MALSTDPRGLGEPRDCAYPEAGVGMRAVGVDLGASAMARTLVVSWCRRLLLEVAVRGVLYGFTCSDNGRELLFCMLQEAAEEPSIP